jgi:hypothetical protein
MVNGLVHSKDHIPTKIVDREESTMSNMSYCRFHNTLIDLHDCANHIYDDNLSEDETWARKKLIEVCRDILNNVDGFDEEDEEDEE